MSTELSEAARALGKKGGSVRSERKREAARKRWAARFGTPAPVKQEQQQPQLFEKASQ